MIPLKQNKLIAWLSTPFAIRLGLALITLLVFSNCLNNDLINWDDAAYITQNPLVRSLSPENIKNIFTTPVRDIYAPLTILSFAIDYHFVGFNSFIFHLNNIILHIAVTLLIFTFARQLSIPKWSAAIGALLFAIHPMHVESVAWATERKDVLYSFFFILSLITYYKYLHTKKISTYSLALLCGLLSLLAKPMALSLPLVLLLCDWFKNRKITFNDLLSKIPFAFYTIPIAWITFSRNSAVMKIDIAPIKAILIICWSFMFHIFKFLKPIDLCPAYTLPTPANFQNPIFVIHFIAFLFFLFLCYLLRRQRLFIFAVLFYVFSIFFLLRTNDLYDINKAADRFMYLPSLGFCLFFGSITGAAWKWLQSKNNFFSKIFIIILIFCMTTLGIMSFAQTKIWKNDTTLLNYGLKINPLACHMHVNKGLQLKEQGRYNEALHHYNIAIKIYNQIAEAYNNRGVIFLIDNQLNLAEKDFRQTIQYKPELPDPYFNLGNIAMRKNDNQKAIELYTQAIKLHASFGMAYGNRGLAYFHLKQYDKAIEDYNMHLLLEPNDGETYLNRALAFQAIHQKEQALSDAQKAKQLGMKNVEALIKSLR